MSFVHLHVHSHFSLLDGLVNIPKACAKAKELGMPALAITDHGNLFSAVHFFNAAKKVGIKPILGIEAYIAPEKRQNKSTVSEITGAPLPRYYHILLLVKNKIGYQNLIHLASQAYLEGIYYKPRIDKDLLFKHSEGLICCSACLGGEIPRLIQANKLTEAKERMQEFKTVFGNDYYFEIMRHGIEEQNTVNEVGIQLARSLQIPLVATNDVHYLNKEDVELHNILLNIQKSGESSSSKRETESQEFYLKSPEEMQKLFADVPDAITNTLKIADDCNFEYKFDCFHFPKVDVPANMSEADYLTQVAWEGFAQRYPGEPKDGEAGKRLQFELDVINRMGFPTYFLVVRDFTIYAKDQLDMEVGCARGSVGGSVVAYCLRITEIDPIKYGLMFERFLNPERVSMPDIDMDFPESRRQEVINYVTQKYGSECVSQIMTVNYIKARTAIRDVGRVLNVPLFKIDKFAKSIPGSYSLSDLQIDKDDPPLIKDAKTAAWEMINTDPDIKTVFQHAQALEGTPRHIGVHAAGVVIADQAIYNYVPMSKEKESITTQFDMTVLESLGLLKMDFLGLRTLDVIRNAVNLIKQRRNVHVDVHNLPMDDVATCTMLSEGHTKGVFQCDSGGMCKLIKEIAPQSMFDCVPIVALYRPGPLESGMVQTYLDCRQGKQEPVSFYPTVEHITKDTYHQLIFQEQIMQLSQIMCGFSVGKADELRKAIGKKDPEKLAKLRKEFVDGAVKTNPTDSQVEHIADELYSKIEFFGRYCFNKAHSAAYGLIMYQTAYLKANYPVEYMCALLTSVMGKDKDKHFIPYLREVKRMGLTVLPPCINRSIAEFDIEDDKTMIFGLAGIKGVSDATVAEIIEARTAAPFQDFYDFLERVKLNANVIKALIHGGAFDCFKVSRKSMADKISGDILKKVAFQRKEKEIGQISMFEDEETGESVYGKLNAEEYDEKELLALEKELTGVYLSKHPMDKYKNYLSEITDIQGINKLVDMEDGQAVIVAGIVTQAKTIVTKKGDAMAFITLEDKSGDIEVVVFASVYENHGDTISQDKAVLLEGYLQIEEVENDSEQVTSKEAKIICLGASNLDKLLKNKKRYIPSPAYVQHRQHKTKRSNKPKPAANKNETPQAENKSLLPRKIRIFLPPENVPILMDAIKKHYQQGLVGIEVCIGKPNSAAIIIELPLQVDLHGVQSIFQIKGLSCKAIY